MALVAPAHAQKTPAPASPFHRYKVGAFECTAVYDGIWEKPHDPAFIRNASLDEVKGAMRAAGLTEEFVSIPFTPLIVATGRDLVLLDAGTGGQVQPTAGKLLDNMKAAAIDPAGITKVMISHFHPDHIFGLMEKGTNAQVFPNAEIVVSSSEYGFWTDPAVIDRLPEARRPLARRIQATFPTWKNVRQVEGEAEVAPGIRSVAAPGHTPGHIAFHIASGVAQMIYSGDTFYQPALSLGRRTGRASSTRTGRSPRNRAGRSPSASLPTRSWSRAITSPGRAPARWPRMAPDMRSFPSRCESGDRVVRRGSAAARKFA